MQTFEFFAYCVLLSCYLFSSQTDQRPRAYVGRLYTFNALLQLHEYRHMKNKIRMIALYLPQFHPIPENDEWWGKGFTEWTNVTKAKPLYPGHQQPNLPTELGFYDLRVPEVRQQQAELAAGYGIEASCYYHYWFGGREILERPFDEVVASGEPDFPFCLCWANETWSGVWHGEPKKVLIEQTYPGEEDHRRHFAKLLPAFRDKRYVTVDDKPMFVIYRPMEIPDVTKVMALWQEMARDAGLPGLHLVAQSPNPDWQPSEHGFDACISPKIPKLDPWITWHHPIKRIKRNFLRWKGSPTVYQYKDAMKSLLGKGKNGVRDYPVVIPNWDNSPRSGSRGLVFHGSTPELFREHLRQAVDIAKELRYSEQLIFLKSWNEWAEGNYVEPDRRFGRKFLEVIKDELKFLVVRPATGFHIDMTSAILTETVGVTLLARLIGMQLNRVI